MSDDEIWEPVDIIHAIVMRAACGYKPHAACFLDIRLLYLQKMYPLLSEQCYSEDFDIFSSYCHEITLVEREKKFMYAHISNVI
jgi:hypothetical protein